MMRNLCVLCAFVRENSNFATVTIRRLIPSLPITPQNRIFAILTILAFATQKRILIVLTFLAIATQKLVVV